MELKSIAKDLASFLRFRFDDFLGIWMIILFAGFVSGCSVKSEQPSRLNEPEAIPVEVYRLSRGSIVGAIEATANLVAENDVTIIAQTSNRVKALHVEEGDSVKAGQLLLELEDYEQRLRLERVKTQLEKQKAELERSRPLYEQNLISRRDYENLLYETKALEISVQEAQRELEYTRVKAPINGVITRRYVNIGDFVSTGQPLFDLVDLNSQVALVYLPDRYLQLLRPGLEAKVRPTALPGLEVTGFIKRIAPIVESQTGTVKVTIGFHDPGQLRPGMYAQVQIITDVRTNAVLIPKRALVHDEDLVYVYRVDPEAKTVERVVVKVELEDREQVEPASGFSEGDLVVIAGQTGLRPGAKVKIVNEPVEPKSGQGTSELNSSGQGSLAHKKAF